MSLRMILLSIFAALLAGTVSAADNVRSSSDIKIQEGAVHSSSETPKPGAWAEIAHSAPQHRSSGGRVTLSCSDGRLLAAVCFGALRDCSGNTCTWDKTTHIEFQDDTSFQCRDERPSDSQDLFMISGTCSVGTPEVSFP